MAVLQETEDRHVHFVLGVVSHGDGVRCDTGGEDGKDGLAENWTDRLDQVVENFRLKSTNRELTILRTYPPLYPLAVACDWSEWTGAALHGHGEQQQRRENNKLHKLLLPEQKQILNRCRDAGYL